MTAREPTKLGEVLRAAREAKFVDLARVERDTKIRARYLSALERGEYRDLPGTVYVKGFLRNYGIYLGLDPEYLIDLYRLEQGGLAFERASGALPMGPRRLRVPRALVITPGALAAVVLTVLVIAFGVYLVGEFVTFARTPDLRITEPATDVVGWTGSQYTVRGTTEPNATITVDGLRENPTVKADATGAFEISVKLLPGANVVTLVANDPLTGRDSSAVRRTITVTSVLPSAAPGGLLRIRVGNAAAVQVSINGIALGAMGREGAVVEWRVTRL